MLHIPPTNLLLLAAKQEPYRKSLSLNEKDVNIGEKSSEAKKEKKKRRQDRKSNRSSQKNMRRDSKMESNDSPEIPDRGETDIPGLHSGLYQG